jgi:hypothetical protein
MKVEKYNVTNAKKWETKDGEEKTFWAPIGKVTIFTKDDGSKNGLLELNDRNVQYSLFINEPKEKNTEQSHSEDISPEDIPF